MARCAWAILAVVGALSCDGGPTQPGGVVERVEISPEAPSLETGGTEQLQASLFDATGNAVSGRRVVWDSNNRAVVQVSETGMITGVAPGQARVSASSEGANDIVEVRVRPPGVATVTVTPPAPSVQAGGTVQLQAEARSAVGMALTGRPVSWASRSPTIARVDESTGLVTGLLPGQAEIVATIEGRTGSATVTVTAAPPGPPTGSGGVGGTTRSGTAGSPLPDSLAVRVVDANGRGVPGVTVTWGVAPGSGSVSPVTSTTGGDGVAKTQWTLGTAGGEQRVTATAPGVQPVTFTAQTQPAPVATVAVEPASHTFTGLGQTRRFSAVARDASGNVLTGRAVVWSSSAPGVASVASDGTVTAVSNGSATITATVEGRTGTAAVTVAQQVANVSVTPGTLSLTTGGTGQLTATATDANGNGVAGAAISWTSSSPTVATVDGSGLVRAAAPGQATITATAQGKSGSASITVTAPAPPPPATVSSVSVEPASHTFTGLGQTRRFAAVARDTNGNVLTGRAVVWSSSAPGVASVASDGTVTAAGNGSATITATVEGRTGTAAVTVNQPPPPPAQVNRVSVEPGSATLTSIGDTRRLSATARDADNNVISGRSVSWTSSAPAIARVASDGMVTAVSNGTATITATVDGVTGTATVTVAQQVANVSVTPGTLSLTTGGTGQLTATATDANGNGVAGAAISWTSSSPTVATVDGSGLVRAAAPGQATITATAQGKSGNAVVTVSALVGAPARLQVVSGSGQEGDNGKFLDDPLVVQVTDASGRPVADVRVRWTPRSGVNPSVSPPESRTDAQGRASTRWNIGGGGSRQRTLEASLPDYPNVPPVTFTAERD
jgi:uncharacterized protein YjdB